MYCTSTIVPKSYYTETRKDAEGNIVYTNPAALGNCAIAIDMAMRMNANPLMVMQHLQVVQGKPTFAAKFLVARINSSRHYEPLEYDYKEDGMIGKLEYNETVKDPVTGKNTYARKTFDGSQIPNVKCTAHTRRKGTDKELYGTTVDYRMAVLEGWYTKSGSKWQTMPEQMLAYRAASFWTSMFAPDLTMGFPTTEEVRDIVDVEAIEIKEEAQKSLHELAREAAQATADPTPANPTAAAPVDPTVQVDDGEIKGKEAAYSKQPVKTKSLL
jgi:hypothetical protein